MPPGSTSSADRATLSRAAVVGAARTMIAREGLDNVSLRRLAGSLGVTAPALYAYVQDKRDLLQGVAEEAFAELVRRFEDVASAAPLERIRAHSRIYIEFAVENPELFRTMFLFPPALPVGAPTGAELAAATRAFEAPLAAVQDAIDAGLLRPIDPIIAALTLWTATHGAADVLLMGFGFDDAGREQLVDQVVDTVIAGLQA